jgi:hypothetical protein
MKLCVCVCVCVCKGSFRFFVTGFVKRRYLSYSKIFEKDIRYFCLCSRNQDLRNFSFIILGKSLGRKLIRGKICSVHVIDGCIYIHIYIYILDYKRNA